MKWPLTILLLACLLASCRQLRYVPVESVRTDSVTIRDTLMNVKLVPYRDSIVTDDTVSLLSNPYAYSRATWSGGKLHHVLGIWPFATTQVRVPYFIDHYRYIRVPDIVEVEKKLTRWQQIKLDIGGLAIGGFCVVILIGIGRVVYKLKK